MAEKPTDYDPFAAENFVPEGLAAAILRHFPSTSRPSADPNDPVIASLGKWGNITEGDINRGINVALSVGTGIIGVKTKYPFEPLKPGTPEFNKEYGYPSEKIPEKKQTTNPEYEKLKKFTPQELQGASDTLKKHLASGEWEPEIKEMFQKSIANIDGYLKENAPKPLTQAEKYKKEFALDQQGYQADINAAVSKYKQEIARKPLKSVSQNDPLTLAGQQGYTTPAFRGLKTYGEPANPVQKFDYDNMYSTASEQLADMYSSYLDKHPGWEVPEGAFHEGAQVLPLMIDTRDYHFFNAEGDHYTQANAKAIAEAKKQGKKGVIVDNVWDEPQGHYSLGKPQRIFITFPNGASTVKSKFASKFDPADPNMLHSIGVIGVGGPAGYISMSEDDAAKMQQQKEAQTKQGQGSPNPQQQMMSPGAMKFLFEFMKANPDIAREMSVRLKAVINQQTIKSQNGSNIRGPNSVGEKIGDFAADKNLPTSLSPSNIEMNPVGINAVTRDAMGITGNPNARVQEGFRIMNDRTIPSE